MTEHIIQVDFQSSFITPMHADTLWGHVCWALRYCYGEKELIDFLTSYSDNTRPLVISNALPEGCLPHPLLPPMDKSAQIDLVLRYWEKDEISQGSGVISSLEKLPYLPKQLFLTKNGGALTSQGLHEKILSDQNICLATAAILPEPCPAKFKRNTQKIGCRPLDNYPYKCPVDQIQELQPVQPVQEVSIHTAVSRISGSAMTGRLFTAIEQSPGGQSYEVYCRIEPPFSEKILKDCLSYISETGFGKRKSVGKGNVHCTLRGPESCNADSATNAFMSLSNFIPKAGEASDGYYCTLTKYGKLGGHFASSPIYGCNEVLPFKYPIVMLMAGSVFITGTVPDIAYGCIVKGVHPCMPEISHYGLAYPWPIQVGV